VRREVVDYIRQQKAAVSRSVNRSMKGFAPPVVRRKSRGELALGRSESASSGSTGLGGNLARRIHRAGPRRFLLRKPKWVDPFPQIPGTVPEKMIFAALVKRGIYFVFHGTPDDFANSDLLTIYAPTLHDFDFLLPEYRVVIDPYSEFHHAQADAVRRDTLRATVLYASGWAYYHPWAHEVEDDVEGVINSIVELRRPPVATLSEKDRQAKAENGYRLGAALGTGAFSVGIANRMRRRAPTIGLRRGRRR